MDTSKEYIKMCEKFVEGRKEWKPQSGDFVYCKENGKVVVLYFNKHHGLPPAKYTNYETAIPLWRQDQLQEMMDIKSVVTLLSRFNEFVFGDTGYIIQFIDSCEQLWLAFVMKEKYNKIWNGEDWIKK